MTATFKLSNPDKYEAGVTIHGQVEDFKLLLEQLKQSPSRNSWPLYTLTERIDKLISRVSQTFIVNEELT